MSRKAKTAVEPELKARPVAEARATVERVRASASPVTGGGPVEYLAAGVLWKVEAWGLFQAEFPTVTPVLLAGFHEAVSGFPRQWLIVRRLFGMQPMMPGLTTDPKELRVFSREALCEELGVGMKDLAAELESVRAILPRKEAAAPSAGGNLKPKSPGTPEALLLETDGELLKRHGFSLSIFSPIVTAPGADKPEPRGQAENLEEQAWFAGRVRDWDPVLRDRTLGSIARQALLTDLQLRRAEIGMAIYESGSPGYERLAKSVYNLQDQYVKLTGQLSANAPWFNAAEKSTNAKASLGELIRGIQDYYARGDTQLLDGVHTALEIQVLLRMSEQVPEPMYRLGLVTWINETKRFLWDPNAKCQFNARQLAQLDAGFKEGVRRLSEDRGETLPDLLREDEGGEFEELYTGPVPASVEKEEN